MSVTLLIIACVWLGGVDSERPTIDDEVTKLQGTWVIKRFECERFPQEIRKTMIGGTVSITRDRIQFGSENPWTYKVSLDKKPYSIDFIGNRGQVNRAIYQWDDGKLMICYALDINAKRPTSFPINQKSELMFFLFERTKDKEKE
jgi:uncharacterized protein (TIGR03067 family)